MALSKYKNRNAKDRQILVDLAELSMPGRFEAWR
jgi:hypothetical protein